MPQVRAWRSNTAGGRVKTIGCPASPRIWLVPALSISPWLRLHGTSSTGSDSGPKIGGRHYSPRSAFRCPGWLQSIIFTRRANFARLWEGNPHDSESQGFHQIVDSGHFPHCDERISAVRDPYDWNLP